MEGYKDVYWSGDAILWKNLIKNYLCSLQFTVPIFQFLGEEVDSSIFQNVSSWRESSLPTEAAKEIFNEIADLFFAGSHITKFPELLASVQNPIRRDQLIFCLKALHPRAIECIFSVFVKRNLVPASYALKPYDGDASLAQAVTALEALTKISSDIDFQDLDRGFELVNQNLSQLDFIQLLNSKSKRQRLWAELCFRFPEIYVKSLDNLLHTKWYAACFVSDQNQASMWGNYGDEHKGVCLKFRTSGNGDGENGLKLNRTVGVSATQNDTKKIYGDVWHKFEKIQYTDKFPEIDFFASIGQTTMPALISDWYSDGKGKISPRLDRISEDEGQWISEFWKMFLSVITCKFNDWQHEGEYRIVLYSVLNQFQCADDRKLFYDFMSLEGITFGLNTSFSDKAKIIDIVREKCLRHSRNDFEFSQAHYSPITGKIEAYPLKHLKLNGD